MLVVQGDGEHLQPLTGVFPDLGGLFIVGRELKEEGKVLWLISDDRSQTLWSVEDWMEYDARWWVTRVLLSLDQLAPRYFRDPESLNRLNWGIYAAPKAEGKAAGGGGIPREERIEQFGLRNLWALWPTKLTLAPLVSSKVVEQIKRLIKKPGRRRSSPPVQPSNQREVPVALGRWRKTPLMRWQQFCRCYNVRVGGDRDERQ